MTIALFFEQVINGLITGSIYALTGSGLALIYGTLRVLNFAHGELYMLGGYFTFLLIVFSGLHPIIAIPIGVCGVFLLSMLIQRITLHYLMDKEEWVFGTIAVTLGFSIFFQDAALHLWGQRIKAIPYHIEGLLQIAELRLPYQRLLVFGCAILIMISVTLLLKYSRFGKAIRATSQDREAASVMGVPVRLIHTLTFGLGGALCAASAGLLAPITSVSPWMGIPIMLKSFMVVILGGLGSFTGAIIAGFLLGIFEALTIAAISSEWRDVISFSALIVIIYFRPWGLFGVEER